MSKNIDWANLGFGYVPTDKRFVANFKDGKWDEGALIDDPMVTMSECAGVLQYAQTCFEGLKAYRTEDGKVVCFRPDLNAERINIPANPHHYWRYRMHITIDKMLSNQRFCDDIAEMIQQSGR